jgi:MtN3 and saliva related transmembrane protein
MLVQSSKAYWRLNALKCRSLGSKTPVTVLALFYALSRMALATYVGIGAGVLTALSLLPQLVKVIREKSSESISLVMLIILLAGLAGWTWYGILKNDLAIILTNAFSLLTNLAIMALTLRNKRK